MPVNRITKPVIDSITAKELGKFILFEGCTMSRRQVGSRYATQFLLDKYGFDYELIEREKCCGAPVKRSGAEKASNELRDYNLDLVVKSGYKKVVTACPGCGSQLMSERSEELDIEVIHLVEIFYKLAKNKELYLKEHMRELKPLKITAHFPCHLHRGMGVLCEPIHQTIVEAFPDWQYIDPPDGDKCCGAGGGLRASQKDISFAIRAKKIEKIASIDPDIVLAACPFCELQIDEGLREAPENIKELGLHARAITPQSLIMMMFKDLGDEVGKL